MDEDDRSYRFTHALARKPGRSVAHGLRAQDHGAPDPDTFLAEHQAYVTALTAAGVAVEVLPPVERFPDSVFVEDTALCLPEGAILLNPGTPSRQGEADAIAPALEAHYPSLLRLDTGHVDGGDILVIGSKILVGLSQRTDRSGFETLNKIVSAWGYQAEAVETPPSVLHFKTDCGLLDGETILATDRLAGAACFHGLEVIEVPRGEEPAANAIRVNDKVLLSEGFPKTAEVLTNAGYDLALVPTTQAALVDGGPSCQSLRFAK